MSSGVFSMKDWVIMNLRHCIMRPYWKNFPRAYGYTPGLAGYMKSWKNLKNVWFWDFVDNTKAGKVEKAGKTYGFGIS